MKQQEKRQVVTVSCGQAKQKPDWLAIEWPLTIIVNGRNYITLLASPSYLEELVVGFAFSQGLLTSGRISAEVVKKAVRMGAGLMISRSAPTSLGVQMAEELGMTLVGFAREQRFNIYCNPWRVAI